MTGQHVDSPVVVGVDGSEYALRAVRWAAAEATRRHVPLRIVSAIIPPPPAATGRLRRECAEHARIEMCVDTATRVSEQEAPGLEIDHQLVMGRPHAVLVSESQRAQLLVVGFREVDRFAGPLIRSVAVTVATHAKCPVVIVRGVERDQRRSGCSPSSSACMTRLQTMPPSRSHTRPPTLVGCRLWLCTLCEIS